MFFCVSWYASKNGGHIWSLEKCVMKPEEYPIFETVLLVFSHFSTTIHNVQGMMCTEFSMFGPFAGWVFVSRYCTNPCYVFSLQAGPPT